MKEKKETDPRVTELLKSFAEAYKQAKGVPYMILWGKEGAAAKSLLHYSDEAFGKFNSLEELRESMGTYFKSSDWRAQKENHSFSVFASSPQKWVRPKPVVRTEIPELREEPRKILSDQELLDLIVSAPETFVRGMKVVGGVMRKANPGFYNRMKSLLTDLVGGDRIRQICVIAEAQEKERLEIMKKAVRV